MKNQIIPPNRIHEIAVNIRDGKTCYIGVITGKIEYFINEPSTDKEKAANEKLMLEVDRRPDWYLKIGDLPRKDLIDCMHHFITEVDDAYKVKELKNALKRANPVRNFMNAIESDLEYSAFWRTFSLNWRSDWIAEVIVVAHNH